MTHQPTVTKNYKNTQSEFDSNLGSCDVSVAPRAVRLSTSPGTKLLLLLKGNSDVPLFFHFLNNPPYVCKPSKNCNPAALYKNRLSLIESHSISLPGRSVIGRSLQNYPYVWG